jgi:hypothetical protein
MTKLCARGKAAAKRKFKVYPSAYANAYASKICAGKIKDPSGTKRKDWGPKKANKGLHAKSERKFKKDKFNKQGMEYDYPLGKEGTFNLGNKPKAIEVNKGAEIKIKKVAKGLHKASATHKAQAKALDSISAYTGKFIKHDSAGIELSNKISQDYYGDLLK